MRCVLAWKGRHGEDGLARYGEVWHGGAGEVGCGVSCLGVLGKVKFRQGRYVPVSFVGDRRDWAGVFR